MKEKLSVPVTKDILIFEKEEAEKAAREHVERILSGRISTWENGHQFSLQEQLSREAEIVKENLPLGLNAKIFVCLRCGECCYYSHLDNSRRLKPNCEKYFFVPRRISGNSFLPAECRIHNDPAVSFEGKPPDPYSLPPKFNIVFGGKEYRDFSEEEAAKLFGKDLWETIRMRNTLGIFHSPGAQFGPCVNGVRVWENEKSLKPGIVLPEGVEEQLEIARFFREEISKYSKIFEEDGERALVQ